MTKENTMLHPFTGVPCVARNLNPGDTIEAGDVYRSVTIIEEKSGLGRWYQAGDVLEGTTIGPTCNVAFLRLSPTLESELTDEESEALLAQGLHAVE